MTLPTFIAVGPGKTGTTWLYKCLEAHPDIRLARNTKETFFFNLYYDRGIGWYEKFFNGFEGVRAVGEVSNNYFLSDDAPARIAHQLPDVRLICTLRSPLERLVSSYLYSRRRASIKSDLEETIRNRPRIVTNQFYDKFLENYLAHFPREQLLIIFYDDIKSHPADVLRQIYEFIGVRSDFQPVMMTERVLEARNPRFVSLSRLFRVTSEWLRKNDFHRVLTWIKLNPVVTNLAGRPITDGDRPQMKPETREHLREIFRPHIERVETITGRDLSHWK